MTVKKLLEQFQTFTGNVYVYDDITCCIEYDRYDTDDTESIISDAEVVDYELNFNRLYIKIK